MKEFWILGNSLPFKQVDDNTAILTFANGKQITIERAIEVRGSEWDWRINGQLFRSNTDAKVYLRLLVSEMATNKRIIMHSKQEVPEICGADGAACRRFGGYTSALCMHCPVAEKFFAEKDGVELVYPFAESAE